MSVCKQYTSLYNCCTYYIVVHMGLYTPHKTDMHTPIILHIHNNMRQTLCTVCMSCTDLHGCGGGLTWCSHLFTGPICEQSNVFTTACNTVYILIALLINHKTASLATECVLCISTMYVRYTDALTTYILLIHAVTQTLMVFSLHSLNKVVCMHTHYNWYHNQD